MGQKIPYLTVHTRSRTIVEGVRVLVLYVKKPKKLTMKVTAMMKTMIIIMMEIQLSLEVGQSHQKATCF